MSGRAAGYAASVAMSTMGRGMNFGGGGGGGGGGDQGKIDWNNFNYPPMLRLIHYDLKELNPPVKGIVRIVHLAYVFFSTALFCNFISAIVYTGFGLSGLNILYAFFNWILGSMFSFYTFYTGYKGIAEAPRVSPSLTRNYKICQFLLMVAAFVLSIVYYPPINGLQLARTVKTVFPDNVNLQNFATADSVIESLFFTFSYIFGFIGFVRIQCFDPRSISRSGRI
eukprot:GILI01019765.1.p1 GENE.GILI01019765.1~~GILI01019765.1.p1  ORF type:complete len:225 (+),score=25.87 GILI01019765.1:79-753(+)